MNIPRYAQLAALSTLVSVGCAPIQDPAHPDECPEINYEATTLKDAQFVGSIPAIDGAVMAGMAGRFPGCAIGIVADGEVKYLKAYGLADTNPAGPQPFTTSTVAGIGSVSKTLTAIAIMRLVELGKIDLDAPVTTYFPHAVPLGWPAMTTRQLLCHQSGLERDPNPALPGALTAAQIDASFGMAKASQHPRYGIFEFLYTDYAEPVPAKVGKYNYSNIGYTVLGAIIDHVTQGPSFSSQERGYERYVWSLLTQAHGDFNDDAALTACIDHPWRLGDIPLQAKEYNALWNPINPNYSGWQGPSGGWCMRIGDLARVLVALQTNQILTPASLQAMRSNQSSMTEKPYGLGLELDKYWQPTIYYHSGKIGGYRALMKMWTQDDIGVVVFANRDSNGLGAIADTVANLYRNGQTEVLPPRSQVQKSATYRVSKFHYDAVQQAVAPWLRKFGTATGRRLGELVSRQSSLGNLLVQRLNGDTSRTEELAQTFLDTLRVDGRVGPYRTR